MNWQISIYTGMFKDPIERGNYQWESPIRFYKGDRRVVSIERDVWDDVEVYTEDNELIELFNKHFRTKNMRFV